MVSDSVVSTVNVSDGESRMRKDEVLEAVLEPVAADVLVGLKAADTDGDSCGVTDPESVGDPLVNDGDSVCVEGDDEDKDCDALPLSDWV